MEHRTYLWLYVAIEGIYETYRRSLRPKETLVDSLPLTVKDAYEKILNRVPQEYTDIVKRIFLRPRDGYRSWDSHIRRIYITSTGTARPSMA
jgi:hypothetical protein